MNTPKDEILVSRFDDYYQEYFFHIARYAYRLTGNSEDSAQLTQQAFLNLYRYILTEPHIKNPKALPTFANIFGQAI